MKSQCSIKSYFSTDDKASTVNNISENNKKSNTKQSKKSNNNVKKTNPEEKLINNIFHKSKKKVNLNNLKKKLNAKTKKKLTIKALSFGIITKVKDGVAFARDLSFASFGELAVFIPSPTRLKLLKKGQNIKFVNGMVVGIEDKLTSIVIFGNERLVKAGDRIITKGGVVSVIVGIGLLGRIINPLGEPIDDPKKKN